MLFMRRIYSKLLTRQLHFEKEKKLRNRKNLGVKLKKVTMDNNNCASYSDYRKWHHVCGITKDQGRHIKLLSYNILAQDLLNEHIYLYLGIDHPYLNWEHRLNKLKEEISLLKPDILCLQEMQNNHLKKFIKTIDAENNFEYIYKKKTGTRTDGCAIVYDKRKFRLVEEYTIEYYKSPVSPFNRENIAVIAKLCTKDDEPRTFLVATTHLLYNPRREDVRLAQIHHLLSELESRSLETSSSHRLPVLLTGDFNFEPFSSPHKFITDGSLNCEHISNVIQDKNVLTHCLKLISAYKEHNASTFQNKWITVDYIFYSSSENANSIKLLSVYNLPSKRMCYEMGKIPNNTLGSDHLCLAIKFSFENSSITV